MVLISLLTLTLTIGLLSSKITSFHLNRVAIIVLLLSGVLAYHSLWLGQLGSGVGIFNGLFLVTSLSSGIDLFIYIVGSLILLISETGVFKYALQLNKAAPAQLSRDGALNTSSGGQHPDSTISSTNVDVDPGIPQGNLKIIDEYPIIALFSVLGINCLISSNDIITIFLSLELQSFAVYILASLYRESESATSAGLKYFLLGSLSSAILLLGVVLIYSFTGLTEFEGLSMLCSTSISNQYIHFSVLLISVGLLFKVAASPFHNWSPDVYDGVPTIVTAWLITMPKLSVFIFMVNFQLIFGMASQISIIFTISSLLSLVIGSLGGLIQFSIKRLLAYSAISHVGFMLLALSVNNANTIEALLFYLIQYSLTNINVFFLLIILGNLLPTIISIYSPIQFISQLKGLFSANSILGVSFAVSMFSIAGIPPLVGFFAKLEVLYSSMYNGYYFLVIVAILTSVISAVYYLNIIRVIYFEPANKIYYNNRPADSMSSFIIANLTLLMSLFIFNPNFLLYSTHLLALKLFLA